MVLIDLVCFPSGLAGRTRTQFQGLVRTPPRQTVEGGGPVLIGGLRQATGQNLACGAGNDHRGWKGH